MRPEPRFACCVYNGATLAEKVVTKFAVAVFCV